MFKKLKAKLNFISSLKMKIMIAIVFVIVLIFAVIYIREQRNTPLILVSVDTPNVNTKEDLPEIKDILIGTIVIYISGEVNNPGVYELNEGARVVDAVEAAGGFTQYANQNAINLAAKLTDEQHILIYNLDENTPSLLVSSEQNQNNIININTATAQELQALSGIGPSIAENIIKHRQARGGFGSIEEIINVSGIGEKMFESIRDRIIVE